MRINFAKSSRKRQAAIIACQAKLNGNMPVVQRQAHLSASVKQSRQTLRILMANIRSSKNRTDDIATSQPKAEPSRQMLLGCMTCMEIYGNGARTIGWTITHPPSGRAVLIKAKRVTFGSRAAARGMSLPNSVEVRRG